jgi:hypothetical protein
MEKLEFIGQVSFRKLVLSSAISGEEIDITNMVMEMNIYEDIFSNYITGTITISDSLDLIHNLPIVGEEKLELEYKTPTMDENIGLVKSRFFVHKVTDKTLTKENTQVYIIHFMAEEGYTDLHQRIGRAYKGQYSETVKRLFSEADALGASPEAIKKLRVDETENAFKFVVPGWSPMKCINWVASRSISRAYKTANYVFYQDVFKYNFVSIDALIDQTPYIKYISKTVNIRTLESSSSLKGVGGLPNKYNIVRDSSNDVVFDVADRMINGMYAGKLVSYDIMSKKVNIQSYDYFNEFDKSKHLNPYPMSSPKFLRNPNSYVTYYPMHYYMHDEFDTDNPGAWVLQRRVLMTAIESYKSELIVAGRTDIHVGQVIEYDFNTVRAHATSEDAVETLHTGKYLITAINHRFSSGEHEMILSITKDSIIRKLE